MNIQSIIKIVKECDKIFFNHDLRNDVTVKGTADYVTQADIEISKFLHNRLNEEFPHISFVSEEENYCFDKNKDYWILDPIDGTTNFMHELGLSAVSLGLYSKGEIIAGIIYTPHTDELFWAEKGKGAYLNGIPIKCSKNKNLSESLGILEFNPYFKDDYKAALDHALKIYSNCQDIRTFGSAAVELAYIACGKADVFLGRHLKPWDFAAAIVIINESGGKITGLNCEFDITRLNQHIVASNSLVHDEFLTLF